MIGRALAIVCVLAGTARASDWKETRGWFEWSTWIRLAVDVQNTPQAEPDLPRATSSLPREYVRVASLEGALGAEVTMAIPTPHVRLGPWVELRHDAQVFSGLQLLIAGVPEDIDMFQYTGEGVLSLRAGASGGHATAQVAYGYHCPWDLYGQDDKKVRYMIGVRFVATATRSFENPRDWSASFGLEFEPVGAFRYLLGISSLY